jgi:predicted transport protein
LIRNFILMGLEPNHQTELYNDHWRPMEVAFGQEAYGSHFDKFMRHYLTFKTGEIPKVRAVYEAFKAHARTPAVAKIGVDGLVADIHAYAGYYCAMALGQEKDKTLAAAFQDLREMKVDVAYPFLLELYHDYATNVLSRDDFATILRLTEAYVFRRAVCAIPTNSLNKTFANLGRTLKKDQYLESVQAHFLLLPSYRRFPNDDEFCRELKVRDLYSFPRRSYWLRRLENHGRKEYVPVDEYTIEHILPQNPKLSAKWKEALGPEWQRIQKTWLHTLGNLTLTGYNAEYSDRPFPEKRDMPGGFKESPLKMNEGLGSLDDWDEDAIQERADKLAKRAVKVWQAPKLSEEVLATYQPEQDEVGGYGIEDHPQLAIDAPMRPLFDAFRKEVLALDPCVHEGFLKLYVAYKAETNFVDVIPQKNRLLLCLNMGFHEVSDPREVCKDVSGQGRWGNGDVHVTYNKIEDLPYIIGLVRQAFEKQMGNGEEDA